MIADSADWQCHRNMDNETSRHESGRSRSPSRESDNSDIQQESSSSPARPIRGRGKGRGRRRAGGRRPRNVGQRGANGPRRDEVAAQRVEERNRQLREWISSMPTDELRALVLELCERDPSVVLSIVDRESQQMRGYHRSPDADVPAWCTCLKCREMPAEEERLCCRQTPQSCLSTLPDFDLVVLDPLVLVVARRYRQDILAAGEDDDYNRNNRHAAYRQFILWTHGHLGAGNRRVIPSCCVWKIRDKFPDNFGNCRGFVGGRLG